MYRVSSKYGTKHYSHDLYIKELAIFIYSFLPCSKKGIAAYTFGPKNMGRFCHNSDGFLMLSEQNVYIEPIIDLSKSNFGRICDDVCITPL